MSGKNYKILMDVDDAIGTGKVVFLVDNDIVNLEELPEDQVEAFECMVTFLATHLSKVTGKERDEELN